MMRRLAVIVLVLFCFGLAYQPAARADSTLTSVLFNVNGATQTDYTNSGAVSFNTGGFNQTTGIGTLKITFNPGAAGTFSVDSFVDLWLAVPLYNEYGTASGSPAAGQTWEIGDSFTSSIYSDVQAGGPLNNTNMLPGQADNFLLSCSAGATCNGDAAMAMGFRFTLTSSEEAVITLNLSTTNPGGTGLVLDQTHPIDAGNTTRSDVFFTGTEVTQPSGGPPPPTPEPNTLLLLGVGLGGLCVIKMRR